MTTRVAHRRGPGLVALTLLAGVAAACEGRVARPDDRLAARVLDSTRPQGPTPGAVGIGEASGAPPPGRILFENACGVCHDRSGQGHPAKGPSLRASTMVPGSPDVLIRIVLDGVRATSTADPAYALPMPAWRVLTDRDLAAILSYVRHTFGNGSSAVAADDVASVRTATAGRSRPWTHDELRLVATRRPR